MPIDEAATDDQLEALYDAVPLPRRTPAGQPRRVRRQSDYLTR